MLSEVEVRCCRRLKSDAVGGPRLKSEVEIRCCRRPKKCTCRLPYYSVGQIVSLLGLLCVQKHKFEISVYKGTIG